LSTRWDAVLADFRRYYQLDLRTAFRELPAIELVSLIRKLPRESALAREESGAWSDWDAHKENTARLLEIEAYTLDLSWADRTIDPNDRAVKLERLQAERAGIKPPPHPMIPPIAMRPHELGEQRLQEYLDGVAAYRAPQREALHVSSSEFDRLMDLVEE
jgi:hypothetical protein